MGVPIENRYPPAMGKGIWMVSAFAASYRRIVYFFR